MSGFARRTRVGALPVIQQNEIAECGLACLAMVAAYHGHDVDMAGMRRRFAVSIKGATLSRLIAIADRLLSARQHGALIVMQRTDSLAQYAETGVQMYAQVTPELLLQIFYPDTPLHDGGAIIADGKVLAAACVMPLSSSGILTRNPERQMGLRHRAALGSSEVSDAVAVVVSEQSGSISIAHAGRMIRRIDPERLENILIAFYQTDVSTPRKVWFQRFFRRDK